MTSSTQADAASSQEWFPGGGARWTRKHSWLAVGTILFVLIFGSFIPPWVGMMALPGHAGQVVPNARVWSWLAVLIGLVAFVIIVGHGVTGHWNGFIINELNRMSLVRLQLIAWSVLVLSAIFTAGLSNLAYAVSIVSVSSASDFTNAMAIEIPTELWAAMGISTASAVTVPVVFGYKARSTPISGDAAQVVRVLNYDKAHTCPASQKVHVVGSLMRNHCPRNAQLRELFKGEEVGNACYVDVGKLQMFMITVIVLSTYSFMLIDLLAYGPVPIIRLPNISEGLVTLLLVSHAGYVTNEAVPHTLPGQTLPQTNQ